MEKRSVSMDTIASALGVSKVTVSKALNDKEGVSESLRVLIKAKAQELGYQMNVFAKALKTNQTFNIGIIIAERFVQTTDTYYFKLYSMLVKKFSEINYATLMEIITYNDEVSLNLPKMYIQRKVDALIIMGQCNSEYLELFLDSYIPVIFLDFYNPDIKIDSIVVDNFQAGEDITNLLIKNGHKDIAFIGNIYATSSIKDRFLGYYSALIENNLSINQDYVISDRDSSGNLFKNYKLPKQLPSAIVCNNDQVAYFLIKRLQELDLKVPDDISIVTFDNTLYSKFSSVSLTSVDNNDDELVNICVKAITKKLTKPEKVYDKILVKTKIVERDSIKNIKGE